MLKRILACSFILAVLPLLNSSIHHSTNPTPFQAVIFAGHTNIGGEYCTCGCSGCICDPGETPSCPRTQGIGKPANGDADDHVIPPTGRAGHSGLDFGSSALVLALGLWLWARLRG